MTPEQKMQKVIEASGECWHESQSGINWDKCRLCGFWDSSLGSSDEIGIHNPSPTDLNELFQVAKKLELRCKLIEYTDGFYATVVNKEVKIDGAIWTATQQLTPAEALLNALYESIKENSHEQEEGI